MFLCSNQGRNRKTMYINITANKFRSQYLDLCQGNILAQYTIYKCTKKQFLNSHCAWRVWLRGGAGLVVVAVACDVQRVRRVGKGLLVFGGGVIGGVVFDNERVLTLGHLSPLVRRVWSSLWHLAIGGIDVCLSLCSSGIQEGQA